MDTETNLVSNRLWWTQTYKTFTYLALHIQLSQGVLEFAAGAILV